LPPFISFSTRHRDLDSAVLTHTDNERFVGNPEVMLPPVDSKFSDYCRKIRILPAISG
jgi:hypothetical protein